MSIALPPDLKYGLITGRFLKIVADGSDADRNPEGEPWADLTITIEAGPSKLLSKSDKIVFLPQPIDCTTDVDGYLIDPQGNRGIYLVATNQDSAILNPVDFTYKVTIKQKFTTLDSFPFTVPADSEQDLAELAPVPDSKGTAMVVGKTGEKGDRGETGPSGGPFPALTGVADGQVAVTANGGVDWYALDIYNLMGVI